MSETENLPNVKEVSPEAEFPGSIALPHGASGLVLVNIADANYFQLSGDLPDIGKGFGPTGGVVISSQALRLLGLSPSAATLGTNILVTAFYTSATSSSAYNVTSNEAVPITGIVHE